jgi:hypothetical protein
MFQGRGAVIALLLTCATLVCDVESAPSPPPPPAPYIPSGRYLLTVQMLVPLYTTSFYASDSLTNNATISEGNADVD